MAISPNPSLHVGVRTNGKNVELSKTRSVLESKINLLRETRFFNEYQLISEIIEDYLRD